MNFYKKPQYLGYPCACPPEMPCPPDCWHPPIVEHCHHPIVEHCHPPVVEHCHPHLPPCPPDCVPVLTYIPWCKLEEMRPSCKNAFPNLYPQFSGSVCPSPRGGMCC
jgi:hypothetical protein